MINRDMYKRAADLTACDTLHSIAHLSQVGVAASESELDLKHMQSALSELFEVIHEIACKGIQLAERSEADISSLKAQVSAGAHQGTENDLRCV